MFHLISRNEGPEWKHIYSSTISLKASLDGVSNRHNALAALIQGNKYS
jgi:hypothetical protein